MSEEQKGQAPEQDEVSVDARTASVTRRQFLIGAGAGLVVGAAGAAGVFATQGQPQAPAQAQTQPGQAAPAGGQPPAQQPAAKAAAAVSGMQLVKLTVNGLDYDVAVAPETTLLEVLKRDLGLTGVKQGCNGSMCSACTVLVDGVAQNSCSLLAIRESGKKITTIEGLEQNGKLHPVQVAFWDNMGYQCGFCTPGQILATVELLNKNKAPTEDQVRAHMSGHMCKCSAYPNIMKSVMAAAKSMA
jgi:aerobic-type carbon monoxide dehydrogenase small subunit (CoxS/CutS family)